MRRLEPNITIEGNTFIVIISRNKQNKTRRFNVNKVGSSALCLARNYRERIKRKKIRRKHLKKKQHICEKTITAYTKKGEKKYKYLCFYADSKVIFLVNIKKHGYKKAKSILENKINNSKYMDFLK